MNTILSGRNHFYIMHLNYANESERTMQIRERLWNYARRNKIIGLNHNFVEGSWDSESIRETAIAKGLPAIWRNQFNLFYNMRRHDIVVILAGWDFILGVGEVKDEESTYDPTLEDDFFPHIRHVVWRKKYTFANRHMISSITGFVNTLYRVEQGTDRWRTLTAVRLP